MTEILTVIPQNMIKKDHLPSPSANIHQRDLLLQSPTIVSDHYRAIPRPKQSTIIKSNQYGALENLKNLVGRPPTTEIHSSMSNLEVRANISMWRQAPRLISVFIARNWYWLKWGLIIGIALLLPIIVGGFIAI